MTAEQIPVLITGLSGTSIGVQILKALRLSNVPYRFIGTDVNPTGYHLSSVDKSYVVPPADHPDYINTLLSIIKEHKVRVVFPGSDAELKILSQNKDLFQKLGVLLPVNPAGFIERFSNKYETQKFLAVQNFLTPKTVLIKSINALSKIDFFPAVCKPYADSSGSHNVFIAQSPRELTLLTEYLLNHLNGILVQEYIGTPDEEYTVGVLADLEGHILGSIGLKRHLTGLSCRLKVPNKTNRAELGKFLVISSGISQGEIGPYDDLTKYCETAASVIGARGPVNFQCRVFQNKIYIFEINPRFSGTTSLRALVGFNEPDILIRKYILNEKTPNISYRHATIVRVIEEKIVKTP